MHNSVKVNFECIIQLPLDRLWRNAGIGEALIDSFSLGCCATDASA
jgi:hypothetical protein